jgi:LDH2 family malate/lactate/ureidoglycolate dehydrogenase
VVDVDAALGVHQPAHVGVVAGDEHVADHGVGRVEVQPSALAAGGVVDQAAVGQRHAAPGTEDVDAASVVGGDIAGDGEVVEDRSAGVAEVGVQPSAVAPGLVVQQPHVAKRVADVFGVGAVEGTEVASVR